MGSSFSRMAQNFRKAGYIFSKSFRVQLWAWGSNQIQQASFQRASISAGLQTGPHVCVPACVTLLPTGTHTQHVHAHTRSHACMHTQAHACTYLHICTHTMYIHAHIYTHSTHMHTPPHNARTCTHTRRHACMPLHIPTCVCVNT